MLLPVYLLMLVGLFMIGNVALARQSLVTATQLRAWDPQQRFGDAQLEKACFAYNQHYGNFSSTPNRRPSVTGRGGPVQDNDLVQGARPQARQLAVAALNNAASPSGGNDLPFILSDVRGQFSYTGITLNNLQPTQTTRSVVLLPRRHQRPRFQEGQQHPVVKLSQNQYFDPNQPSFQPMSPKYQGFFDGQEGIWDKDARLRGSMQAEHGYFQGQVNQVPLRLDPLGPR